MATANPISKKFLITGAARGIGRGLSRLLLQKGHRVLLADNNVDELENTASRLSTHYKRGQDFEVAVCNLRHPSEIQSLARVVRSFFSDQLDVLINNAADTSGVGGAKLSELKVEDWNASLETNLTAPMLLSQACLPLLRRSEDFAGRAGGCIIHMSSTRAFMSEPDNEPYAATKAGLLGLTQSMAVSLATEGVRVNAILPGWIHVGNECKAADEKATKWEDGLSEQDHLWHLTGRVGKVEDVLGAVQYLVESEGVSGSELVVDGGVSKKMVYPE